MHRPNRKRTTSYARGVCAACLVGALAACSSGGGKTPTTSSATLPTTTTIVVTTTLPTAQAKAAAQRWFAANGQPLIAFERISGPLATGVEPKAAACIKFFGTDLQRITKDQNTLVRLAQEIPNGQLSSAVKQDVSLKLLVGTACGTLAHQGRKLPSGPTADASWRTVRAFSQEAHLWLARFGIKI